MSTEHNTPGAQLAAAITRLQKSPMLAMSGHAGTLKVVVDYLAHQERRITDLETQVKQLQGMGGAIDEFKRHIHTRFEGE